MLQRTQSIWLLFASLSIFFLFFLSIAGFQPDPEIANAKRVVFSFNLYGLNYEDAFSDVIGNLYAPLLKITMCVIAVVCILTPIFIIFKYKNRSQQMLLSKWTMLMDALLMVAFFLLADFFAKDTHSIVSYKAGIYLPSIAILFLFLSIRFIKKDEKLVRSADRIR
jgi:glucan phosphoethanolaminetransferase (alkaline phosphatase superfamily)